jgi:uncharacterized phiE125 gp8 family phage protein
MALRLITAPAVEPFTLTEAKAHLRVIDNDDDALIAALIKAAVSHVDGKDGFLGRALVTQTWELVIDAFPAEAIKIPLPPLQSVTSIKYDDAAGIEQTLATDQYSIDTASEPGWVAPLVSGWPGTIDAINAVRIRFVAGYAPDANSPPDLAANVPGAVKAAMLLLIGSLYEHRETIVIGQTAVQIPWGAEQLLRPFRVQLGMA